MMDGAMNTELSRKGFQFNTVDWLRVNSASPQPIADIHADYARSGAEIHIANSFATGRHVLEHFGLADEFSTLNRAAVEVCRGAVEAAASHDQWIAGSISTFAHDHDRRNLPRADIMEKNVTEQAEILADAGCDAIALEMLFDIELSLAMLKGAQRSGLPVLMGFYCSRGSDDTVVLRAMRVGSDAAEDTRLAEVVSRVLDDMAATDRLILTVMHAEMEDTAPALETIRRLWDGPTAVYPNTGRHKEPGGWDMNSCCTPDAFADGCERWIKIGANIVGGCCGVGPEHIRELGKRLKAHRGA